MSAALTFAEQAAAAAAAPAGAAALAALRAAGAEAFARLGFPSTRDEDWRYTSVSSLAATGFAPAPAAGALPAAEALAPFRFDASWPVVVFVNGRFAPSLSSLDRLPPGVRVLPLAEAAAALPELVERHLGALAPAGRDGFTALNAAFAGEGVVVHVAREMEAEVPLHLLHVSDAAAAGTMRHVRHLVVVERHARATVVESHVALAEAPSFATAVVEAVVEDGAALQLLRVQREAREAWHVGTVEARQGRDSALTVFTYQAGGRVSRSNVYTVLGGEGAGCTVNGLYLLDGEQHGDHQTRVEHLAPKCHSREAYKGLIDGRAHGVFNGKVYVHPEAQQTDGKQTNHTLLLSPEAQVDTKPQLEIFADDVKCTHGATVGRIDETALFYLKSRGVGATLARQLLMYAFAADVLETIEQPAVVAELERLTLERYTG